MATGFPIVGGGGAPPSYNFFEPPPPPPAPLRHETAFHEMIPRKSTINNNLKSS